MKHTLIAILVLASLVACKNNDISGKTGIVDSAYTVVTYGHYIPGGEFRTTLARRWVYDTIMPDPGDKTRNKMVRDTAYTILIINPAVDSAGNAIKRVSGKDSIVGEWLPKNKRIVIKDFDYDFRSVHDIQLQAAQQPIRK